MCADKASDWEERQKERSGEIEAITMAITTLNDDDALDIFKKSLPSAKPAASFLQKTVASSPAGRVVEMLKSVRSVSNPVVALIASTAVSKLRAGVDFSKIVVMIDEMVALMKQEQVDEAATLEQCEGDLSSSYAEKKDTQNTISSLSAQIGELEESISADKKTVEKKNAEIAALDVGVTEATEQRATEKKDFEDLVALNSSAIQLIGKAKNQLNKFYNPQMYKAPEPRELSEQDRIFQNSGGQLEPEVQRNVAAEALAGFIQMAKVSAHAPASAGDLRRLVRQEGWKGQLRQRPHGHALRRPPEGDRHCPA